MAPAHPARRVLVAGATGYIGRRLVAELVDRGLSVVALGRQHGPAGTGAEPRRCEVTHLPSLMTEGFRNERFDAVFSCLASRTGAPGDAWAVDHQANVNVIEAARATGAGHVVLLSAICVQRPRLAFQRAKLASEKALVESGVPYSIVRPTAFFKSLAGQVERVKRGAPFVVFGDGTLTACKPISERDLAVFMADCPGDPARRNAILPVGGPGPALTPRAQGALLFAQLGKAPRYRQVPVAVLDAVIAGLSLGGRLLPSLADKAELARIGRYYGTESMLVWDAARERYDADATPSWGTDTLDEFYARVVREGLAGQELGAQAVFTRGGTGT